MKLWVRSQERDRLEVCHSLSIQQIIQPNRKHSSWGIISNFGCVGEYHTKERCLEIVDEIQWLIRNNGSTDDRISQAVSGIKSEFIIYEIPKE